MEEYIKWLENKIEVCLEDKDLQREHWAFCQALKKYRELSLSTDTGSVCHCDKLPDGDIAISSKALQKPYGDLGQTDL